MARKLIISILILILLSVSGLSFYIFTNLKAVSPEYSGDNIAFTVHKGESFYSVLDRLNEKGLIQDIRIYKVYNRFIRTFSVKSGSYSLSPAMEGREILLILEEGKQELVKITIPEGLLSSQIADLLEKAEIVKSRDFIAASESDEILNSLGISADSAEGYLFPDTYFFQKDFPAEKVLEHMVSTYFENLEEVFPFYKELSHKKLQEKVILASIVEKEYRVAAEAPLIASVFNNRLKIGMPLQSCATVIYVITEEQGKPHPERVYFRDLEIPSEFNTYIHDTLPPAPISNPGRTALEAAFNPAQTDYLFFVVRDSAAGTHTFSNTLADHNNARQSYIQGFRSK